MSLSFLNFLLLELDAEGLFAYSAHYGRQRQVPRKLIEEIDRAPEPAPPVPLCKFKFHVRDHRTNALLEGLTLEPKHKVGTMQAKLQQQKGGGLTLQVTGSNQLQGVSVQLVQHKGSLKGMVCLSIHYLSM